MQPDGTVGASAIVETLLHELYEQQHDLPDELLEPQSLADVRFHLGHLALDKPEKDSLHSAINGARMALCCALVAAEPHR